MSARCARTTATSVSGAHLQAQARDGADQGRVPAGMAEVRTSATTTRRMRPRCSCSASVCCSISADQACSTGAERRRDVRPRERVRDVGGEEAELRAAVEGAALELIAIERLRLRAASIGVGQLDLAAGAAALLPPGGRRSPAAGCSGPVMMQIGRRLARFGFSTIEVMRRTAAPAFADADHAVHVDLVRRHLLDRDPLRRRLLRA